MAQIAIRLLGRFSVHLGATPLAGFGASKVQELLAYLLLHRDRPQSREVLAGLFWGDTENWRAKKYLRQALWQLQSGLRPLGAIGRRMLRVDPEWIELRSVPELWLDVAILDKALSCCSAASVSGALDAVLAQQLRTAVGVYEDDLLPGWYGDWCAYERERLQASYLTLLDVLMADCEARGAGEEGLRLGALSLRRDRARERTHQRMMRLYCCSGDRGAALRQFDRCIIAMDEELAVTPAAETRALYEQIRADRHQGGQARSAPGNVGGSGLADLLDRLQQISRTLDDYRQQVQAGIQAVELAVGGLAVAPSLSAQQTARTTVASRGHA